MSEESERQKPVQPPTPFYYQTMAQVELFLFDDNLPGSQFLGRNLHTRAAGYFNVAYAFSVI